MGASGGVARRTAGTLALLGLLAVAPSWPGGSMPAAAQEARTTTVAVGADPIAVVADGAVGRVYVLSQGRPDLRRARFEETASGSLTALDIATGAVLGKLAVGHVGESPDPVAGAAGMLALDGATGRLFVLASSMADYAHRTVLPGSVRVVDAARGTLLRTVGLGINPRAVAVDVRAGHVFVATEYAASLPTTGEATGTVAMLDATSGALLHTTGVGIEPQALAVDERTGRVFVANLGRGCPQSSSDLLCRGGISVLDAGTGSLLATLPLGRSCAVAVAEPPGRAFVDSIVFGQGTQPAPDRLDVLDAAGGARLGGTRLTTSCSAQELAPDGAHGWVFAGAGATIGVLDARNGALLRSLPAVGYQLALDARRGLLYALDPNYRTVLTGAVPSVVPQSPGLVGVIDPASGRVLGRMPVGTYPRALAVDDRTGRVFVANQQDGTVSILGPWPR